MTGRALDGDVRQVLNVEVQVPETAAGRALALAGVEREVTGLPVLVPCSKGPPGSCSKQARQKVACLRQTIHRLAMAAQITEPYALASMAVSFRITQYANQIGSAYSSIPAKAVHAVIPRAVFPAEIRDLVAAWLRPEAVA
jgi:hypothetical protein